MPTISIAMQKGGSAKTTTTINLAAALQQQGKNVLLIDADPQASLTQALGIPVDSERNLFTEITRETRGENGDLQAAVQVSACGLPLVASSIELAWAELELVTVYGREQIFSWMLDKVKPYYDFIFIDCPPSVGMLTINALVASDFILMPLAAEFLPFSGVGSFMKHFKTLHKLNKNLEVLGLLLTRYDERKIMNRDVQHRLQEEFGEKLFRTHIRNNMQIAKAQEAGLDIFHFDRRCHGAEDYASLATEFLERV